MVFRYNIIGYGYKWTLIITMSAALTGNIFMYSIYWVILNVTDVKLRIIFCISKTIQ